jgi:dTDP-4-dehydrorhamnose 3,5-epimerase
MFTFKPLDGLPDVMLVEPVRHGDARGWFAEVYKRSEFAANGIVPEFRQDNHSLSAEIGTLRGLHYQVTPFAQGKLIRVIAGEVYDVAVDIRPGSATFGRWAATTLSAAHPAMLWIPEGYAHGFQTLAPDTEVVYKTTSEYSRPHERGVRWDDPVLRIAWPVAEPVLAQRDREWPPLSTIGSAA